MENFVNAVFQSETGPEKSSKKAIVTYKTLVENKTGRRT